MMTTEQAEARIPRHLLYTKVWPTSIPTKTEARLLAEVRCIVADTLQMIIGYRDPDAVLARYAQLMQAKAQKKPGVKVLSVPHQGQQSVKLWTESEMSS